MNAEAWRGSGSRSTASDDYAACVEPDFAYDARTSPPGEPIDTRSGGTTVHGGALATAPLPDAAADASAGIDHFGTEE